MIHFQARPFIEINEYLILFKGSRAKYSQIKLVILNVGSLCKEVSKSVRGERGPNPEMVDWPESNELNRAELCEQS